MAIITQLRGLGSQLGANQEGDVTKVFSIFSHFDNSLFQKHFFWSGQA
uniref:Uncharacterized protein n=1 Tax=Arundo donax TaxID=35708 RepID=A0A0A8XVI1_ARUDO